MWRKLKQTEAKMDFGKVGFRTSSGIDRIFDWSSWLEDHQMTFYGTKAARVTFENVQMQNQDVST